MIGALLIALAIAAPEVRIVAPKPAALAPKLGPWLVLFGDVLPALHPRSLKQTFAAAGFDPLVPSTWPKDADKGGLVLSGTPEALIDLAGGQTLDAWRARAQRSQEKRPGDLWISGHELEGLKSIEGSFNVGDSTVGYDLQVMPADLAEAQGWIGARASRPLIEVKGTIADISGTFGPAVLSELLQLTDPGLKGPAQALLLDDGALIIAVEIDRGRVEALLGSLGDRDKKALGRVVAWSWPGATGHHLDQIQLALAKKRPALYADVTPRALLPSLEGRGLSRIGPRLSGSQLMMVQFAAGRALAALDRIQIEIDRRRGGLWARGQSVRTPQKP